MVARFESCLDNNTANSRQTPAYFVDITGFSEFRSQYQLEFCDPVQAPLRDLSDTLHSDAFAQLARQPNCPRAFTRRRQLPLPALVAGLLCMRGSAWQCHLDDFFGSLGSSAGLVRGVSDHAFAKARSHLHVPALVGLN